MNITQLLVQASNGNETAYNELFPLIYDKLRLLAQNQLNREYSTHTLCKTELVHEAYEKMVDHKSISFKDRSHFFAIAARSMRQILVDYARKKKAAKRDIRNTAIDLDITDLQADDHEEHILALNNHLNRLRELDERLCTVVDLRFFGGMSIAETAEVLDISTATVNRDWIKARAWLYQQLMKPEQGV